LVGVETQCVPSVAPMVEGAEGIDAYPSKVQCLRVVDDKVRLVVALVLGGSALPRGYCAGGGWSGHVGCCSIFRAGASNGDTLSVIFLVGGVAMILMGYLWRPSG
jgi:hypothetical protein